ncbi:MAG: Glycosyl transferase, group 1 [candidate division WWE3 bacterium GW2011_GWC1_47_10]|uniref:Glycosyl transferase, group 1 n=2 Tax=Katanobacteria TaxID=422282 RepID=A0A0G1R252_UNCKA|nr:MAG: Glycosyl transferase, group 1 [candidate division WWE3 bacterium GW2011_GWC1_47_10]
MKKVLYFVPQFPGLTETFIEREVSKLVGHNKLDVTVFSLEKGLGETNAGVEAKTVYRRLSVVDVPAVLLFAVKHAGALVRSFGLAPRVWQFAKAVGYAKLFTEYGPNHIHAHFLSEPSTLVMIAANILNVPYSISAHARDVFVDGELVAKKVESAKFIAVCNKKALDGVAAEIGGLRLNVVLVHHGIDTAQTYFAGDVGQKASPPMVFVGSRLVEKKGIEYAIEAAKLLKDKGLAFELHIVGPGPLYQKLADTIKSLGVGDVVFIHGEGKGLPHAQVREFFKKAAIFVHSSVESVDGDTDGIPNFVAEAALAKLPIVTTHVGSITELIDDTSGILVEQKDSAALANAIETLLGNANLRNRLGDVAYQKAVELFDLEKNVGELEKLFLS